MGMNSREKFLSVMRMEDEDYSGVQVPKVEFGYWAGTIRKWFEQGLKKRQEIPDDISDGIAVMANKNIYGKMEKLGDVNVQPVFGLDQFLTKFPVDYSPGFKKEIIDKDQTHITYRDEYGVVNKTDANITTLPLELSQPVKDRDSWEEYKQNYGPETIDRRLPANFSEIAKRLAERDFPIRLGGTNGGFLGFPRQIMGLSNYMIKLHDDPGLIHDICTTFCDFLIEYYSRICDKVKVDCILIWEDMAGRMGSLISPGHFREFLTPNYRRMVSFAKDYGIDIVLTDSDGYVEDLIPLIVETGVTGMYPFERAAGNDLLRIRQHFKDFQIIGGFDKRVLFESSGRKKIDDELKITESMLSKGRYIPHIDHFVSMDCKWDLFSYYRTRLNEIIDGIS